MKIYLDGSIIIIIKYSEKKRINQVKFFFIKQSGTTQLTLVPKTQRPQVILKIIVKNLGAFEPAAVGRSKNRPIYKVFLLICAEAIK
jgi:hypothetical protein